MSRMMSLIGVSTILIGSGLLIGASTSPAGAATATPGIANNCTWIATGYGGVDDTPDGEQATCYDTPTGEWQVELFCLNDHTQRQVTEYSAVVEGNNTIGTFCPGHMWEITGKGILDVG